MVPIHICDQSMFLFESIGQLKFVTGQNDIKETKLFCWKSDVISSLIKSLPSWSNNNKMSMQIALNSSMQ